MAGDEDFRSTSERPPQKLEVLLVAMQAGAEAGPLPEATTEVAARGRGCEGTEAATSRGRTVTPSSGVRIFRPASRKG